MLTYPIKSCKLRLYEVLFALSQLEVLTLSGHDLTRSVNSKDIDLEQKGREGLSTSPG